MASTYVARHTQEIDGEQRLAGELVPEAATWDHLQSHLTVGFLRPTDVPDEVYVAAVRKYCPGLLEELAEQLNLDLSEFPEDQAPVLPDPEPAIDPTIDKEHSIVHPDAPGEDVDGPERPRSKKAKAKPQKVVEE